MRVFASTNRNTKIPDSRIKDVIELKNFIYQRLGIYMDSRDVYDFWCSVSEDWSACWLNIDTHYDGETREEFLEDRLCEYGTLVEIGRNTWIDGAYSNSKRCPYCGKYATKIHEYNQPLFDYIFCPYCGKFLGGSNS